FDELRAVLPAAEAAAAATPPQLVLRRLIAAGERALAALDGAWALAFVDGVAGTLLLARDHFGQRPLYLHAAAGTLFVASEIPAILRGSGARFTAAPVPVARFLEQSLLDAQPATFFAGIDAVAAGHSQCVELQAVPRPRASAPYWRLPERPDG